MKIQIISNVVNVCILVLVAAIFLAFAPRTSDDIQGIVLPIKPLASSSVSIDPRAVQVYSDDGSAPWIFQSLGEINLEKHFSGDPDADTERTLITRAQALTAQLGGNGFIIKSFGHTEGLSNGEMNMYQLQGVAINSSNAVSHS